MCWGRHWLSIPIRPIFQRLLTLGWLVCWLLCCFVLLFFFPLKYQTVLSSLHKFPISPYSLTRLYFLSCSTQTVGRSSFMLSSARVFENRCDQAFCCHLSAWFLSGSQMKERNQKQVELLFFKIKIKSLYFLNKNLLSPYEKLSLLSTVMSVCINISSSYTAYFK